MGSDDVDPNDAVSKYNTWWWPTVFFAIIYSLGVPYMFMYLVRRFKPLGIRGDRVVQRALGWHVSHNAMLYCDLLEFSFCSLYK